MNVVGVARMVDVDEGGMTCRVRLFSDDGLPTGRILTGVQVLAEAKDEALLAFAKQKIESFPKRSETELKAAAWQNALYNSHVPVEIE